MLVLTIVEAFLQLAKATRLVGFDVMQFTIALEETEHTANQW
jgi:arginase family enzyme